MKVRLRKTHLRPSVSSESPLIEFHELTAAEVALNEYVSKISVQIRVLTKMKRRS